MVAIEINGQVKTYSKIPNTWNGVLNYNSVNNAAQQYNDGWREIADYPDYDYRTHKLGELYLVEDVYQMPVLQLSNEVIAQNVSQELGAYLDEVYPLWERIKHTAYGSEAMLSMIQGVEYDEARLAMVQNLLAWITRCRVQAENMVVDLYTDGTLPDFNFETRPE